MTEPPVQETTVRIPDRKKSFAILVDGYVRDLFTTGMILQRMDYDVYITNTAEDALKVMETALPALVITELTLPQMSGLEMLVRLRHDPRTKDIPIMIHTSQSDPNREKLCRASGCVAFLKKPADPGALYSIIQRATEDTPRQHIRLRTLLPVRVGGLATTGNTAGTEYVSELSENGIFVCTLSPRPVNAVLPVTLMIHSIPVKLKAMVLRTVVMNGGFFEAPGMAMKFVEISPTDLELLRNFIKGQIMRDIPAQ